LNPPPEFAGRSLIIEQAAQSFGGKDRLFVFVAHHWTRAAKRRRAGSKKMARNDV
jgi:hypothetical protein